LSSGALSWRISTFPDRIVGGFITSWCAARHDVLVSTRNGGPLALTPFAS
jgi:hypothetical protein